MTTLLEPAPADTVEALTEASEHLAFARGLLSGAAVDGGRRAALIGRIEGIERRLADPRHYLAVIGEFNSGKSTLINALLRDPLLRAGAVPTTAAVIRLRHGETVALRTWIKGDECFYRFPCRGTAHSQTALGRRLRRLAPGVTVPKDVRGMLDLLTTDRRVAPAIRSVSVEHPAAVLAGGLVILDTPGTNARQDHTDIARHVVADEADAAAVVLAQDEPLGESLCDFLTSALDERLLGRCVFVVTKMDHVDPGEQERLVDRIRERVARRLALSDPVVLATSVGAVVRRLEGKALSAEQQAWAERFAATERQLGALLTRQRAIAVSDRVLRLLADLLAQLEAGLAHEQSRLVQEEQALASSRVTDLEDFLSEQQRQAWHALAEQVTVTRVQVGELLDLFPARLVEQAQLGSLQAGSDCARLRQVVGEAVSGLNRAVAFELGAVGAATSRLASQLDATLAAEYAKVAEFGPAQIAQPQPLAIDVEALAGEGFDGIETLSRRLDQQGNLRLGGGAVTGATIGTMMAPGLGTLVGAGIGLIASAFVGSEKRDARLRDHVRRVLETFASDVCEQIHDAVAESASACEQALAEHVASHRARYGPLIAEMIRGHEQRRRDLTARRRGLDTQVRQVADRATRIDQQRARLAAIDWR